MTIIESILEERRKQDEKWGIQNHGNLEWLAILGEEYGEVCEKVVIHHFGNAPSTHSSAMTDEIIQVMAVCVAWLEHLGYEFDIPEEK